MKFITLILLLTASLINFTGRAQKPGFYGNRLFIQVGGMGHYNLIRNWNFSEEQLKQSGYKSQFYKNKISGGFYGAVGYQINRKIALSLDIQNYNSNTVSQYDVDWSDGSTDQVQVKFSSIHIMPRLEIAANGSNAPVGLVHILGIGLELIHLNTKEALFFNSWHYDQVYIINKPYPKTPPESFTNARIMNFLYGMEYRQPLSKKVALTFGSYFHLNTNFGFGSINRDKPSSAAAKSRTYNLWSLRFGLQIML